MSKPIIIDCDPGIDDVMAILLALSSSELDVRLITTVAGNHTQENTLRNALQFVSFLEKYNVEIARGLEKPILRDLFIADDVHGKTGLGNVELPHSNIKESERSAIQAIRETVFSADEPVTIVAVGPLTNIAILLLTYPEVKENIEMISIMGGACRGGNVTSTAEFNIFVDPEAADVVFNAGIPIVMSGLDVTHKAFLTREDTEKIRIIGSQTSQVVYDLLHFYSSSTDQHEDEVQIRLHDLCAVAYLINPGLFEGTHCRVDIETRGELTYGTTVVDVKDRTGKKKNAKVLLDVQREAIVDMFYQAIRSYK
jgi:pyrimidine-specific ribonucleoside hydrolase